MNAAALIGPINRYGIVTVLAVTGRTGHGHLMVRVRCDCGREKQMRFFKLTSGQSRSCGCVVRQRHIAWSRSIFGPRSQSA